ncbi:MAG: isocitrate/isopropylmalate dehydrogenase family protein [Synergistaceae bacterium]|jgi:3-isopropylmalate dehydrogenase|nr:isocitrate/isopropylmalate dehydrogenase family protein [Synergistaceae bacterium]
MTGNGGHGKKNNRFSIAVLAGDGIGPEVIAVARRVVEAASGSEGASFEWTEYPFGAAHYLRTKEVLPDSAIAEIGGHSAMMLGAMGAPSVKPGILERGILLTLRFVFDQYINLRPAMSLPNVPTPVPLNGGKIDSVVIRENTEDLYMGLGDISSDGTLNAPMNLSRGGYKLKGNLSLSITPGMSYAAQVALNTSHGVSRIARYACETAIKRGENKVTIVTKSNAAPALYGFFEDIAKGVIEERQLKWEVVNVDALCYHLVRRPDAYGVLLCPNLFGDIVSDLQAGLAGGMGTAAGGNIGDGVSMFEPVHGSAPDIAGTGKANPVAAILSGALMLRHLGLDSSAARVEKAVSSYLMSASGSDLPFEFGGSRTCAQVGDGVLKKI